MDISKEQIITIDEASKDFSKAIKIADEHDKAIITQDNKPKYVLINIEENPLLDLTHEEQVDIVSNRIFKKYNKAFETLADS